MIPTLALRDECMKLLAADTATLASVVANKLHLNMNNATPSEQSVLADFTEASFTGHTAISVTAGTQPEGLNPGTNDSRIDLSPPVGGFRWQCTALTLLPQTIYGFYLTDNAGVVLLAAEKLATPIVLTAVGQVIDLGDVKLTLLANSIS